MGITDPRGSVTAWSWARKCENGLSWAYGTFVAESALADCPGTPSHGSNPPIRGQNLRALECRPMAPPRAGSALP